MLAILIRAWTSSALYTSSTTARGRRRRSLAVEEDISEHRLGPQGGLQDRPALHQNQTCKMNANVNQNPTTIDINALMKDPAVQ